MSQAPLEYRVRFLPTGVSWQDLEAVINEEAAAGWRLSQVAPGVRGVDPSQALQPMTDGTGLILERPARGV